MAGHQALLYSHSQPPHGPFPPNSIAVQAAMSGGTVFPVPSLPVPRAAGDEGMQLAVTGGIPQAATCRSGLCGTRLLLPRSRLSPHTLPAAVYGSGSDRGCAGAGGGARGLGAARHQTPFLSTKAIWVEQQCRRDGTGRASAAAPWVPVPIPVPIPSPGHTVDAHHLPRCFGCVPILHPTGTQPLQPQIPDTCGVKAVAPSCSCSLFSVPWAAPCCLHSTFTPATGFALAGVTPNPS